MEAADELLISAMVLRRGTMRLARRLRMERPDSGVPLQEITVLAHLHRRGAMSAGEIAAAERVQPQTLTRALAALEDRGAIRRQADQADRRRSVLSLTEAGRAVLASDMRQRDSWLSLAMTQELTTTERRLLVLAGELMERLAEAEARALRPGPARQDPAEPAGPQVSAVVPRPLAAARARPRRPA